MQVVAQSITNAITANIVPTLGAAVVIVLVMQALLIPVRNRGIRELGGIAAAAVWMGWMAMYYKVI